MNEAPPPTVFDPSRGPGAPPPTKKGSTALLVGCGFLGMFGTCGCLVFAVIGAMVVGEAEIADLLEASLADEPFVAQRLGTIEDLSYAFGKVAANDGDGFVYDAVGTKGRGRIECLTRETANGVRIARATLLLPSGESLPLLGVGDDWHRPYESQDVSLWPVTEPAPTAERLPSFFLGTWRQVDLVGPIRVETTRLCKAIDGGATRCRNAGTMLGEEVGWETTYHALAEPGALERTTRDLPDGEPTTQRMRLDRETRRIRFERASASRTLESTYDLVSPDLLVYVTYERSERRERRLHATGWMTRMAEE